MPTRRRRAPRRTCPRVRLRRADPHDRASGQHVQRAVGAGHDVDRIAGHARERIRRLVCYVVATDDAAAEIGEEIAAPIAWRKRPGLRIEAAAGDRDAREEAAWARA